MKPKDFEKVLQGAYLLGLLIGVSPTLEEISNACRKFANTQECKHSGRLGDREERREKQ